jgi:hypothetical protein
MKNIDKTGLINVLIGLFAIGSGFSGRYGLPGPEFVLPMTKSPIGLYVIGGLIVAHGLYQIARNRPR